MKIHITVDTEVWPVHGGGWPHKPLPNDYWCERELEAYFLGKTRQGDFGLPFQLRMLRSHGLVATFFVDPLFSFALGIEPLRVVVQMITVAGQRIGLHLHPEWLTDRRCRELPVFQGPRIGQYAQSVQRELIRVGLARLEDAGAPRPTSFRAGSWGADIETLRALRCEGILVDSSLNAASAGSLPSVEGRAAMQEPSDIEGVCEFPLSRLDDRVAPRGRAISVSGTSWSEMRFALESCHKAGRETFVLVMHSNEFVKTDRLWKGQVPTPRRMAVRRFEKLCNYLDANRGRFSTIGLPEYLTVGHRVSNPPALPKSWIGRTAARYVSQALSRWY